MANGLLVPIYRDVYNEDFSSNTFSNRMQMQKLIYLLQEAGISIGDYSFHWYKHGPYSQQLQNDILVSKTDNNYHIRYSETAKNIVNQLALILNKNTKYKKHEWAECLASLQYLRSNVFSIHSTDREIIKELIKRKPHLSDYSTDELALKELKSMYN
ncbi:hypothetical protein [uncultured Ruminococcus sp.]|uniref:hypothetical protein n=1 Tax=uncultured Ruminococcus sp. TaxID=165186 RepID=UPI0025E7C983|nr:hypothetical protein [uncultured Ruminococcus sp.]